MTINIVEFVVPEGGEHEVHFDKNASEGENASKQSERRGLSEPFAVRNGSANRANPARSTSCAEIKNKSRDKKINIS
jgi:hypothetical protein